VGYSSRTIVKAEGNGISGQLNMMYVFLAEEVFIYMAIEL
jgi:hypothetical protein